MEIAISQLMGKEVLSRSFAAVVSNGEILSVSSPLRIHYICLDYSNVIEREIVSLEKGTPLQRTHPCNSYRSLYARSAKLRTKRVLPWGHRLPSLDQKHPNQHGSTWAKGKSAVVHSSWSVSKLLLLPHLTAKHIQENLTSNTEIAKGFLISLNLRVCKITRTYYMKGDENKWMFRQVVPFVKKHKLHLLILGGFYQRVY